jgi:hypothetical protein
MRDARIPMIYEGTNEIQAIDLVLRKMVKDDGATLSQWLAWARAQVSDARTVDTLHGFDAALSALDDWTSMMPTVIALARTSPRTALCVAGEVMRVVHGLSMAGLWAHAVLAARRVHGPAADAKCRAARYWLKFTLPETRRAMTIVAAQLCDPELAE